MMPDSSKTLCNRYDVLAWGGAVLALITLAILPASVSTNFLTAVFAFISLVGFLMVYMKDNLIAILLIIGCFFLVVFILALQSEDSGLSGTAYLANFGSYFGGVMTPIGLFVAYWAVRKQEQSDEKKRRQKRFNTDLSQLFDESEIIEKELLEYDGGSFINLFDHARFFRNIASMPDYYGKHASLIEEVSVRYSLLVNSFNFFYKKYARNFDELLAESEIEYLHRYGVKRLVIFWVDNVLSSSIVMELNGYSLLETAEQIAAHTFRQPAGQLFQSMDYPFSEVFFYNQWIKQSRVLG